MFTADISVYRILLGLLSLYFIINRTFRFIKKETRQSLVKYLAILLIWILMGSFAIFPIHTRNIMTNLGIRRDLEGLLLAAFTVIFLLIFRLLSIIEKLEKNITEIVRHIALYSLENKRTKKN